MAVCPSCGAPQVDGLLCHTCTLRLERELGDVPAIVAELDVTLSKQARIGTGGKAGKGGAHEKNPIHVGALTVADDLANTLTTWARDVLGETIGWATWDRPASVVAAHALLSEMPSIRKHPAVEEILDEITDAVEQARRVVDRPADSQFVGPCGADVEGVTCTEELYARPLASTVRCKVCGSMHDVIERRAWLLKKAEDVICTVKEASRYMGEVGHITVTEASIRGYLHRKRLAYKTGTMIRLGDLMAVVLDDSERKSA